MLKSDNVYFKTLEQAFDYAQKLLKKYVEKSFEVAIGQYVTENCQTEYYVYTIDAERVIGGV